MITLNQNKVQLMKETSESAMNLPEGWAECQLSDVIYVQNGYAFPSEDYRDTGVPLIRQTNLAGDKLLLEKCVFLGPSYLQSKKDFVLRKGDILVGMSGSLGKICIYDLDYPALQNQRTGRIVPYTEDALIREYFYYFLQTVKNELQAKGKGLGVSNISASDIETLSFRLAPITEQKRIVAKAEELLARVNTTKERLAKVSMILKRFRQAVLATACSGRLTADWRENNVDVEPATGLLKRIQQDRKKPKKSHINRVRGEENIYFDTPDSWSFCFFEDICSNKPHAIKAGPFGSSLTKSCYTPSGYKIYGQEQVIKGDATYGDYYIDEKKFLELKSCEVEARDLLISLVGTIGRVLIIPDEFEKGIINPRLVKISLHSEIFPQYIAKYLGSPLAINMFKRDSHGGTMEILNLKMLKGLPIPLPPVFEQHEIVHRVESMLKLADAVEKRVAVAKLRAEKLTQAILAKAFRGELVPTEAGLARRERRPYETASELLTRIKSDREATASPKARQRLGQIKNRQWRTG